MGCAKDANIPSVAHEFVCEQDLRDVDDDSKFASFIKHYINNSSSASKEPTAENDISNYKDDPSEWSLEQYLLVHLYSLAFEADANDYAAVPGPLFRESTTITRNAPTSFSHSRTHQETSARTIPLQGFNGSCENRCLTWNENENESCVYSFSDNYSNGQCMGRIIPTTQVRTSTTGRWQPHDNSSGNGTAFIYNDLSRPTKPQGPLGPQPTIGTSQLAGLLKPSAVRGMNSELDITGTGKLTKRGSKWYHGGNSSTFFKKRASDTIRNPTSQTYDALGTFCKNRKKIRRRTATCLGHAFDVLLDTSIAYNLVSHFVGADYSNGVWPSRASTRQSATVTRTPLVNRTSSGFSPLRACLHGRTTDKIDFGYVVPPGDHTILTLARWTTDTDTDKWLVHSPDGAICGHSRPTTTNTTKWNLVVTRNGSDAMVRVNGETVDCAYEHGRATTKLMINHNGTRTSNWVFAELMTWSRCLSREEIGTLEQYMSNKYNLQLDTGVYNANFGLCTWIPQPRIHSDRIASYQAAELHITFDRNFWIQGFLITGLDMDAKKKYKYTHRGFPLEIQVSIYSNGKWIPIKINTELTSSDSTFVKLLENEHIVLMKEVKISVVQWADMQNGPPMMRLGVYGIKDTTIQFVMHTPTAVARVNKYTLAAYAMLKAANETSQDAKMGMVDKWYKTWLMDLDASGDAGIEVPRVSGFGESSNTSATAPIRVYRSEVASLLDDVFAEIIATRKHYASAVELQWDQGRSNYETRKRGETQKQFELTRKMAQLYHATQHNIDKYRGALLQQNESASTEASRQNNEVNVLRRNAATQHDVINRLHYRRRYLVLFGCILGLVGIIECCVFVPAQIRRVLAITLAAVGMFIGVLLVLHQRTRSPSNFNRIVFPKGT